MIGGLVAVLLIVTVGSRVIDGLRRTEAESILARLPEDQAVAYYDILRRRMRRIILMRALALLSLLWIFVVLRQRLVKHEAPPAVAAAVSSPRPRSW
jgi:hypothetical protein